MISYRLLQEEDYTHVMLLEDSLPNDTEVVIKSTGLEVMECLRSGLSVGVFDNNHLVAYSLAYMDDYRYACYVEKCVTVEGYRGRGYQVSTIEKVKSLAQNKGVSIALAVVSPKNTHSLANFTISGFETVGNKENLFGGINTRVLLLCRLT